MKLLATVSVLLISLVLIAAFTIEPLYGWFMLFAVADFAACYWQVPEALLKLFYGHLEP